MDPFEAPSAGASRASIFGDSKALDFEEQIREDAKRRLEEENALKRELTDAEDPGDPAAGVPAVDGEDPAAGVPVVDGEGGDPMVCA